MIRSFSARVSTWLLTWPIPDSGFLSLERYVPSHCPKVVHYGPNLILVETGFHSRFGDLLNNGQRSSVLLL